MANPQFLIDVQSQARPLLSSILHISFQMLRTLSMVQEN